jgi:hypothetical protein
MNAAKKNIYLGQYLKLSDRVDFIVQRSWILFLKMTLLLMLIAAGLNEFSMLRRFSSQRLSKISYNNI